MNWLRTNTLVWVGLACLVASAECTAETSPGRPGDYVVLIHGLGYTPLTMSRLEWSLAQAGYRVLNLRHSPLRTPIEELSDSQLSALLREKASDPEAKVHFVTHSMGGILVREHLARHPLPNLGRVVMLAPPNGGSEVVDWLRKFWPARSLLGPNGRRMGTAEKDLPRRLGPVQFDLGVIAGDRSWNPILSWMIPGRDDGKVSIESAKVEGMADFLVIHSSHIFITWRKQTHRQVIAYLQNGCFDKR